MAKKRRKPWSTGVVLGLLLIFAFLVWPEFLIFMQLRFKLPAETVAEMLHYVMAVMAGPVIAQVLVSNNLSKNFKGDDHHDGGDNGGN